MRLTFKNLKNLKIFSNVKHIITKRQSNEITVEIQGTVITGTPEQVSFFIANIGGITK